MLNSIINNYKHKQLKQHKSHVKRNNSTAHQSTKTRQFKSQPSQLINQIQKHNKIYSSSKSKNKNEQSKHTHYSSNSKLKHVNNQTPLKIGSVI